MSQAGPPVTGATLHHRFDRRNLILGAFQGGVGLLLATRLGYLALIENRHFRLMAESNRVSLSLIPPRRGWILDRSDQPLASNQADFRVDIIPEQLIDADRTLHELAQTLGLDPIAMQNVRDRLLAARGFQPVEAASHLDWEKFAAVSVRQTDMPGVAPLRSFARYYPTGPCVGHLTGYVGTASAKEYEADHNPLFITPGFKVGKSGLEKHYDAILRGVPGARRNEVTARGQIVRALDTQDDIPGQPLKLTINAGLQEYAARRLGAQAGTVVVMDCHTGDILSFVSMPSYDPNSFSQGIGRVEWRMLAEDERVPLRNKVLHGLYPPGSTVKPTAALSFLEAGLDPNESTICTGGLRVGNRVFHCWNHHGHGKVDMLKGIYQSCDVYFYTFAQRMGMDVIAGMMRRLGLGQTFPLPLANQSRGIVADGAWKEKHMHQPWAIYDTVNCTIGQGYILVNPLQQAVVASRLASGRSVMPRLAHDDLWRPPASLGIAQEHLDLVRRGMWEVVNGRGTAGKARLPISNVQMAGKTGTAQVVGLDHGNGKGGAWKRRDHGHFICFAPTDNPRYAAHVLIEHGGGSGAAYPVARDVMTFLFDPQKAWDALLPMEAQWGGTPQQRMAREYAAAASKYGTSAPRVPENETSSASDTVSTSNTGGQSPVPSASHDDSAPLSATSTPHNGPAVPPTASQTNGQAASADAYPAPPPQAGRTP